MDAAGLLSRADCSGGPDACWLWLKSAGSHGYGQTFLGGTVVVAHRAAWTLLVGPIPEGMALHHRCHVKRCINPRHLELVTPPEHQRHHNQERYAGVERLPRKPAPLRPCSRCGGPKPRGAGGKLCANCPPTDQRPSRRRF